MNTNAARLFLRIRRAYIKGVLEQQQQRVFDDEYTRRVRVFASQARNNLIRAFSLARTRVRGDVSQDICARERERERERASPFEGERNSGRKNRVYYNFDGDVRWTVVS